MRRTWTPAGRPRDALTAVAWIGGAVLEEGEPVNGPRGMALAAPRAAMLLHRAADAALAGYPAPAAMLPEFAEAVEGYVATRGGSSRRGRLLPRQPCRAPDASAAGRAGFITAEMIRRTSFIGTVARADAAHRRAGASGVRSGGVLDPARPGACDRGLGPHPPRVRVKQGWRGADLLFTLTTLYQTTSDVMETMRAVSDGQRRCGARLRRPSAPD